MAKSLLLLAVIVIGAVCMWIVSPYDIDLTTWLYGHKNQWFVDLMSDSMFELETFGGGDLIVFYSAACLLLYLCSSLIDTDCSTWPVLRGLQTSLRTRPGWADWLRRNRLRLEFLVVSAFCCSTLMVKLLKWIMARPRPKKYFWGTRPFYEWWEVGPYFLDEGTYRASFPSGHTASAITLMGLVYVLYFGLYGKRYRRLGVALFLFTIAFALTMATARIMTRAHWPTDVTFSIFGGWALIHLLFFYGIKVDGGGECGAYGLDELSPPPPFRGIRICWYLSLFCLALVGLFLGFKHFLHDRWPWLIVFSILSMPLMIYAAVKSYGEGLFRADG
ncbi:MAG: phosphatase PAP2 family protein [Desulfocapsaceae bacterium]